MIRTKYFLVKKLTKLHLCRQKKSSLNKVWTEYLPYIYFQASDFLTSLLYSWDQFMEKLNYNQFASEDFVQGCDCATMVKIIWPPIFVSVRQDLKLFKNFESDISTMFKFI